MSTRRKFLKVGVIAASLALAGMSSAVFAADTIKVGILHSLSGTMAISETSLKDMALFTIDEINAKGGVLGKKLEPVVVDPASNWPLFAEKARQLLTQDKVAVTFGCWTSVSRKSVLPVFEELNGLVVGLRISHVSSPRDLDGFPSPVQVPVFTDVDLGLFLQAERVIAAYKVKRQPVPVLFDRNILGSFLDVDLPSLG